MWTRVETHEVLVQTDIELLRVILKRAVPTAQIEVIPLAPATRVVLVGL